MIAPSSPRMRIWWKANNRTTSYWNDMSHKMQKFFYKVEIEPPLDTTVVWRNSYVAYDTDFGTEHSHGFGTTSAVNPINEMSAEMAVYISGDGFWQRIESITFNVECLSTLASLTVTPPSAATDWQCGDWVEITGGGKFLTLNTLPQEGLPHAA